MGFSQIIGQDGAINQLRRAYEGGRLSHAYIFDGPEGVGKHLTAQTLATLLLCEHPAGSEPCGLCTACRQMAAGTHPDYIELAPDGRTIKIKQLRDLRNRLANTANYGGYTVVVIEEAELMGIEAANAFLKTLEEPKGPTCFVLITSRSGRLVDTIRSRAQTVHFRPLSRASILRILPEAASEDGELALDLSAGSLTRVRHYLDDVEALETARERQATMQKLLEGLSTSHDGALVRTAESYLGKREDALEALIMLRAALGRELRQRTLDGSDLSRTIAMLHHTTTARERMETNTDPAFILGALFIELAREARR